MRKAKRIISLILAVITFVFLIPCFTACDNQTPEGAHVFMFKTTGNKFGDLMFEGFLETLSKRGERAIYKCPAEATVAGQIELLDTLIIQKVKSITISACGLTGYDMIFKKAREAGIKVISVDSSVSPHNRITHVDPCSNESIGSSLVQAATLIALGIPYPKDGNLEKATENALKNYTGKELNFGILTASVDTAAQNNWIAKMQVEVEKDMYKGKVNSYMEKKYGDDDIILSATQANAFVAEDFVDVIIAPTTVAMVAAGQAVKTAGSKIKITGLGLPSERQGFMPKTESDNEFDFPCPYMMLWNVMDLGSVAGGAILSVCDGLYSGKEGEIMEFDGKKYTTTVADDGGTKIVALDPYVFHKGNMADWIGKL